MSFPLKQWNQKRISTIEHLDTWGKKPFSLTLVKSSSYMPTMSNHLPTHTLSLSLSFFLIFFASQTDPYCKTNLISARHFTVSRRRPFFDRHTTKNVFDENVEESRSTHWLRLHETDSSHFEKMCYDWNKRFFLQKDALITTVDKVLLEEEK